MSWRFDRPEFLDLESHTVCPASGLGGRYFSPPEITPLIVELQCRHSHCAGCQDPTGASGSRSPTYRRYR